MFLSPSQVMVLLEHYKYLLIFPIAVIEGPIIIIISGFLVYLRHLNFFIAYPVLVMADMIGDSMYYSIGKYWARSIFIRKLGLFLGYDEKSETFLENHFKKHKGKTFLIAKVSHGVGGAVQVAGGVAKVPFTEFIWYSFLGTTPKVLILLLIGYYIGSSYEKIDHYFDSFALITLSVVILVIFSYIIFSKYAKHFLYKE